jgi:anti-sigma regulatory factor (Ser/Thr protein kinase)
MSSGERTAPFSEGRLECTFGNRFSELQHVIEQVRVFLERHEIRGRAAYGVNLAVEEMATNILKYGYEDSEAHLVQLRLEVLPETVAISLEDDGRPFDPLTAPEPDLSPGLETREPGGLGISLVRKLARRMSYERCDGKNQVTVLIDRSA